MLSAWKPSISSMTTLRCRDTRARHLYHGQSFKQTNSEDHTTISTDIPYARIHNEGGDIRHPYREVVLSYRGKTGALKLTKTNTETQQRKVTALRRSSIYNHITHMPQRQFMPITQSDTPVLTRRCESVIIRKLTTALKS